MTSANREHENGPPSSASLCLPAGYRQRERNETHDEARDSSYWAPWRVEASGRFQWHVYRWARDLIVRERLWSVLDLGCGVGTKLREILRPVCDDITAVDQPNAIAAARSLGTDADLIEMDLEKPAATLGRTFDVILCADVLEHLLDPDPALALIRASCHQTTRVLLSTPDRRRRRGRACMQSDKPEHVREWSAAEFARYARTRGLKVETRRMLPQDDSPARAHRMSELLWRLRLRERSGLACTTLLCRLDPSATTVDASGAAAPQDGSRQAA